jgi:hypothetical protein
VLAQRIEILSNGPELRPLFVRFRYDCVNNETRFVRLLNGRIKTTRVVGLFGSLRLDDNVKVVLSIQRRVMPARRGDGAIVITPTSLRTNSACHLSAGP